MTREFPKKSSRLYFVIYQKFERNHPCQGWQEDLFCIIAEKLLKNL